MKKTIHKEVAVYVAPEVKCVLVKTRRVMCLSNPYGDPGKAGAILEYIEEGEEF